MRITKPSIASLQIFLLASCMIGLKAQAECTQPSLVSPAQREIAEASPRIEWTPVANIRHYLVWLESRVPEGRVLMAEEFRTGATYLVPPRPLTGGKATVRVTITAVCRDNTQATLSARFRIDGDNTCRLPTALQAESNEGVWKLRWDALQSAQRYEIRVHSAVDGKPVLARETGKTVFELGRLEPGAWMVAVQPQCKGLKGANTWLAVGS